MDGVVQIDGLHSRYGELLALKTTPRMALDLREDGTAPSWWAANPVGP
jgi:hypothetical protein